MTEPSTETRSASGLRLALLALWYLALLFLIFLLHDLPSLEFRYWRM